MTGTFIPDRRRGRSRLVLLVAAAAAATAALAGCGTAAAPGTAAAGSSGSGPSGAASSPAQADLTLCTSTQALTRVVVTSYRGYTGGPEVRRVPKVTVTILSRVRKLAEHICALPGAPRGTLHCPMNTGATYRFAFSSPSATFPPVVVEVSGCQLVTGSGKERWVARTPEFWPVLSKIGIMAPMHLPVSGHGDGTSA